MAMPVVTVILGSGASRGVSYATGDTREASDMGPTMPSPLDSDFFDLLQHRVAHVQDPGIKEAMQRIIDRAIKWKGESLWQSMEKMFYSLHVSAVLNHKLIAPQGSPDVAKELVNDFVLSIRALLKEAHGPRACTNHSYLLQELYAPDAVITFNYDFVAESVWAETHGGNPSADKPFGDWFYGFSERPSNPPNDVPTLYKLHGSLNWELREDEDGEVQNARRQWPETWNEFAKELDYSSKESGEDHADERWRPPVLLPFWDKRIEKGLWLKIWKGAADQLRRTDSLIVWGYSLPTTDLKARELLRLAFGEPDARLSKVAVIDPSRDTQDRWRSMFVDKQFWRFSNFEEFNNFRMRQSSGLG
ncbi:MAG: hypothetical protein ACRD3T_11845, partial [Terriglobia bacterium]